MAWTGDPVWLADVLRAAGLDVIEHEGWRDRGHGDFRDLRGVLCHHTAGGGKNDWRIVQDGRADLLGPLAQLVLERDGSFRVIAAGVCWHAGRGSWPGWPTDNANYHVIGIEAVSRGDGSDWTPAQLDAYKRGCAAILARIGRDADDCVGHKEYSAEGKIDPAGIDMDDFRGDVQKILDGNPNTAGGTDMPSANEVAKALLETRIPRPDGSPGETLGNVLAWIDQHAAQLVVEQLGPGSEAIRGPVLNPKRWPELGNRTQVEALKAILDALKIAPRGAK